MDHNRKILKSFAVGDQLRIIQKIDVDSSSSNADYYYKGDDKSNCIILNEFLDKEFHYIMKDETGMNINSEISKEFIEELSEHIEDNLSSVYYDNDSINLDRPKKILQYNERCYSLDTNSYEVEDPYTISTFCQSSYIFDELKSYISSTYDFEFFNEAQNVNNKRIPIYNIENIDSMLNDIYFINMNKKYIDYIIDNFNQSTDILFNSDTLKIDKENYDSILIENLSNKSVEMFEYIFSHLDKSSFYRFFIPIGEIEEKNSYKNNDYMYSFALSNKKLNSSIPINYYSLKNLKNPEGYHDYYTPLSADFKKIQPASYNLSYNILYEIFKIYFIDIVNEFNLYLNEHDILLNSGKIIKENELIDDLINIVTISRPKFQKTMLEDSFNQYNDGENHIFKDSVENIMYKLFEDSYRTYIKNTYGVDIYENSYAINKNDAIKYLKEIKDKFLEDCESLNYNDDTVNGFKNKFEEKLKNIIDYKINDNFDESDMLSLSTILKLKGDLIGAQTEVCEEGKSSNTFEIGIFKSISENILNYMKENDTSDVISGQYVSRIGNKIDDYMNQYDDMFDHENSMKKISSLTGKRIYEDCFKNTSNDLYISYKYLNDSSNPINSVTFVDRIKGEHYYKEFENSKSNVFSLNVKNSGLAYDNVYSFDQVIHNIKNKYTYLNGEFKDKSGTVISSNFSLIENCGYYRILYDEKIHSDEINCNLEFSDSIARTFKYFKCSNKNEVNDIRNNIKSKIQIRKTFEDAIRRSIHRYIPVNTTLWKIEYNEDNN